jgi:SNF2 family DNA or RNA helicase
VRLPRLDLKPSRLGITALSQVIPTAVALPAKIPLLPPSVPIPPPVPTPAGEKDHPILRDVRAGRAMSLRLFLLRVRAEELALVSGYDQLTCLPLLKGVDSYDYQERTASHVLRELAGRALLADEVGLGKTIEACIILKELYARGLVRKVLILTPASLVTQWRDELAAKFHVKFEVAKEPGDWAALARVVCSIDTAKSAQNMAEIQGIHWDMVIVDEAHKLRDNKTLNWKLVNGIGKRYILMLSATPFQNDLMELFNMITILRPGQLYTEREFRRKFLRRGNPREARDPGALRQLLRQVMVRNRRGEVDVRFTQRIPETRHLEMFEPERRLYESAVQFCRERFGDLYGGAAGLVAIGYLKQLCSSTFSFRESLVGNVLPRAQATKDSQIVREAESLLRLADDVRENVKLEALVELLKSHEDRVLVFTQYRGTQDFIAARLRIEGIPHTVFNGSLSSDEKDRAIGQFRGEARVLVSTESGGEGRNLQFAFRMVNYDLPWNPMRVEQRIGRIHRMGQTRDVYVTSLACKDTVEDYILRLLEHKLNLFRLVVGEVDGILGKLRMDDHIAKLFLVSRDDVDFRRRMEEFGDELVALRTRYEHCKQDNDQLLCKLSIEGAA